MLNEVVLKNYGFLEVTDESREIYNDLEIKRSEYIKRKKDDELEALQAAKKTGRDKKKKK